MKYVVASTLCAALGFAFPARAHAQHAPSAIPALQRIEPFFIASGDADGSMLGMFSRTPVRVRRDGFELATPAGDRVEFVVATTDGSALNGTPRGVDASATRITRFHGREPTAYTTHATAFRTARVIDADRGVALDLRSTQGALEYDLTLDARVATNSIALELRGARDVVVLADGALRIETARGAIEQSAPKTFARTTFGERRELASRCIRLGPTRIGFEVEGRADGESICIDPVIAFGTYLGTGVFDEIRDVTTDVAGNVYVTGWTSSAAFPVTGGAYDTVFNGNREAFVAGFTQDCASLAFATFLGGGANDEATAIAIGPSGLTIAGRTESSDFPTTPGAFSTTGAGGDDVFVTRLSATGATLLASTLLGGGGEDVPYGLALDETGAAWIAGGTASGDFPVTPGVVSTALRGTSDAFMTRLDASLGALVFSTFIGGFGAERATDVQVRTIGPGNIAGFVAGSTTSGDFPATPGAFDPTYGGSVDGFLVRITAFGTALPYATYVGGAAFDVATALAIDPLGEATVVGETWSAAFPTSFGAAQTVFGGGLGDAFALRVNATGTGLDFSTFIGGSGDDAATAVALDYAGAAHIGGVVGDGAPLPGAFHGGGSDAMFARLSLLGDAIVDGAFVGGSNADAANALTIDCIGRSLLAGSCFSGDVTAIGGFGADLAFNGLVDGFVVGFAKATITCGGSPSATNYGAGKPGTFGVPTLTALVPPTVPTPAFTIRLANGRPGALPVLFLGFTPLSIPFDGGTLLANPVFVLPLVPYPGSGQIDLTFPFCDVAAYCGATAYLQAMFVDPGAAGFYMTAQTAGLTITLGS